MQNFFSGPARPADWDCQNPPYFSRHLRQPQQRGQNQTAERAKIGSSAQQKRRHVIDTHLPIVLQEGEQKQRRGRAQPEQQVQQKGQPAQMEAAPDGPHSIVNHAQRRPQQEPLTKDGRLARHIDVHQRSSREKKPPRLPPSSS